MTKHGDFKLTIENIELRFHTVFSIQAHQLAFRVISILACLLL